MKKGAIVALVFVAIAIALIVTTFDNAGEYVTFAGAKKLSLKGDDSEVHVVGKLKKDPFGNIIGLTYDDQQSPVMLSFPLIDDDGREERVVLYDFPKPAELDKSEKIVVIGSYKDDRFQGEEILLKCPSKYENKEI